MGARSVQNYIASSAQLAPGVGGVTVVGYNNTPANTSANSMTTLHDLSLSASQANFDKIIVSTQGHYPTINSEFAHFRIGTTGTASVITLSNIGLPGGYNSFFNLTCVLVAGTHYTKGTAFHILIQGYVNAGATQNIYADNTWAIGAT